MDIKCKEIRRAPHDPSIPKKVVWCRVGSRYVERWWGFRDLQGFQDIDFPKCTIITQDFKDSKILIFQGAPQLFKISKTTKIDSPRCIKIPRCTILIQDFEDSKISIFQDVLRCIKIPRSSNSINDLLRFQDVDPFSKTSKPHFLTPTISHQVV